MALTIDDPEAEKLARELAARTGETVAEVVVKALRERLRLARTTSEDDLVARIMEISRRASALPRLTHETPDEIIGYDERGLPR